MRTRTLALASLWFRLPRGERLLLIRAAVLLTGTVVAVRCLPFRTLLRLVHRVGLSRGRGCFDAAALVRAVDRAGRLVPGGQGCLPRALAMQILFRRSGLLARFRMGVDRRADGSLAAHAWVVYRDRVVSGPDVERYTLLLSDPWLESAD